MRAQVFAGDRRAFLEEAGLVGDQHTIGVAEVLDQVVTHVIAHRVGVPHRRTQQPLHPLRVRLTSLLGQRPAQAVAAAQGQALRSLLAMLSTAESADPTDIEKADATAAQTEEVG